MLSESVASSRRSAPSVRATVSGYSCTSTAVIVRAPARRRTATTRAPIGPQPTTSALFPGTSPARATACHATAAGSATAAVRRDRSGAAAAACATAALRTARMRPRCAGTAPHYRGTCSPVRGWGDRPGTAGVAAGGRGVYGDSCAGRGSAAVRGRLHHRAHHLVPEQHRCLQNRLPRRPVRSSSAGRIRRSRRRRSRPPSRTGPGRSQRPRLRRAGLLRRMRHHPEGFGRKRRCRTRAARCSPAVSIVAPDEVESTGHLEGGHDFDQAEVDVAGARRSRTRWCRRCPWS